MERKEIKKQFESLLMAESPLKCKINIRNTELMVGVYKKNNNIYFYIDGDCVVEIDDIVIEDLAIIYKQFKENYNER